MNKKFFVLVFSITFYFFSLQNMFSSSSDDEDDNDVYRFDRYYLAARGMLKIKDFQSLYTKIISKTKTVSSFDNLPAEIIVEIASYLSPSEFNSLKKINKRFYDIVKGNSNFLYKNYLTFHYSYYKNDQSTKDTIEDKINKYFKTSEDFKGSTLFNYEPFKSWISEFYKTRIGVIVGPDCLLSKELDLYFNYLNFIKKRNFLARIKDQIKSREQLVYFKLGPPMKDKILRQFLDTEEIFHKCLINNTLLRLESMEDQNDGLINPYWKFKLLYYKGKINKAINYLTTINKNLNHDPEILYLHYKDSINKNNKKGKRSQDSLQSLAKINFIQWEQNLRLEMFSIHPNVQKDYLSWYIKSCRHRISQAQYYFGKNFQASQNLNQATELYFKAAKNGYAKAQLALYKIYINECQTIINSLKDKHSLSKSTISQLQLESTVKKINRQLNFELSEKELDGIKWLSAAARQGLPKAQYQLGFNYKHANHIFKDQNEAKEWFRRSAEQGYAKAQYNLAETYKKGLGVERDYKRALRWYRKADKQGHKDARVQLEELNNKNLVLKKGDNNSSNKTIKIQRNDHTLHNDNLQNYDFKNLAIPTRDVETDLSIHKTALNYDGEARSTYTINNRVFKLQNVSGTGMNCFFNAMGLKRDEQVQLMKNHSDDSIVRYMVANEIVSASNVHDAHQLSTKLRKVIDYPSFKQGINKIDRNEGERATILAKQNSNAEDQDTSKLPGHLTEQTIDLGREQLLEDLRQRALSLESYNTFVNDYIAKGNMMGSLVDVQQDDMRANYTSIDAIAYLNNIGIKIYKPIPRTDKLHLSHKFIPSGATKIVYLYHECVHFQLLVPDSLSETTTKTEH